MTEPLRNTLRMAAASESENSSYRGLRGAPDVGKMRDGPGAGGGSTGFPEAGAAAVARPGTRSTGAGKPVPVRVVPGGRLAGKASPTGAYSIGVRVRPKTWPRTGG